MRNEGSSESMQAQAVFQRVLDVVRRRVSRVQYETWFHRTRVSRISDGEVVVRVPNAFHQEWMARHFRAPMAAAAQHVLGKQVEVRFEVGEMPAVASPSPEKAASAPSAEAPRPAPTPRAVPANPAPRVEAAPPAAPPVPIPTPAPAPPKRPRLNLQPNSTFENFITGPSNQFARAGSWNVAEDPGGAVNPLFLYGSVGLGKTHLLQAVCHEVLRRRPDAKIVYLSCEEFTNEYVTAVQRGATEDFRGRFRNVDMLLIDDIHFLANKERTQEEFFHTFNALFQARRQIILSSDAPPEDIPTLAERLVSRFKWGLVAKLEQPETETRMAIIRRKAEMLGLTIPNDVVDYIASNVRSNIREIEGAIQSVRSRMLVDGAPADLALAKAALEATIRHDPKAITLDDITQAVATHHGVKVSDLRSKKRTKSISLPRQIVMFLAREETGLSLEEIGDHFGGRDHTTVLYAANKVSDRIEKDEAFKASVERLRDRLRAR